MLVDALAHPRRDAARPSRPCSARSGRPTRRVRAFGESIVEQPAARRRWSTGASSILDGAPIAGAELDIWQNGDNGLYTVQDPEAPEDAPARPLPAAATTAATPSSACGRCPTRSRRRAGRRMLEATGRHPWRPGAHPHDRHRAWLPAAADAHLRRHERVPRFGRRLRRQASLIREFVPRTADDPERPAGVAATWCSSRTTSYWGHSRATDLNRWLESRRLSPKGRTVGPKVAGARDCPRAGFSRGPTSLASRVPDAREHWTLDLAPPRPFGEAASRACENPARGQSRAPTTFGPNGSSLRARSRDSSRFLKPDYRASG